MLKAYAYIRVSGKSQLDGDGPERQRIATQHYARQNRMPIVHEYVEAISGSKDSEDRPKWTEMVAAILANGVSTIIIESLNRLGRDLMVQEHIVADMHRRGITLISVAEPDLGSTDPTRVLVRHILGAISQYDKCMLVLKLRASRQRVKAAQGYCDGAKPYGHLEDERGPLAQILALRAQGMSYTHIADQLNADGAKPRRSYRWHASTVRSVCITHASRTRIQSGKSRKPGTAAPLESNSGALDTPANQ